MTKRYLHPDGHGPRLYSLSQDGTSQKSAATAMVINHPPRLASAQSKARDGRCLRPVWAEIDI